MIDQEESEKGWKAAAVKCDVCSHEWIAVYWSQSDKLECPNCHELRNFEEVRLPPIDLKGIDIA